MRGQYVPIEPQENNACPIWDHLCSLGNNIYSFFSNAMAENTKQKWHVLNDDGYRPDCPSTLGYHGMSGDPKMKTETNDVVCCR